MNSMARQTFSDLRVWQMWPTMISELIWSMRTNRTSCFISVAFKAPCVSQILNTHNNNSKRATRRLKRTTSVFRRRNSPSSNSNIRINISFNSKSNCKCKNQINNINQIQKGLRRPSMWTRRIPTKSLRWPQISSVNWRLKALCNQIQKKDYNRLKWDSLP